MRKWLKWIGIVFLIPIVLVLLLSVLLYVPPVQNFVVRQATKYASKATGMQIGIERIRLSFPLDLTVKGIEVLASPTDTMAVVGQVSVRVNPMPLVRKIVTIESFQVKEARFNTGNLVEGMLIQGGIHSLSVKADYINLATEEATLNALDLSDADIMLRIDSLSQEEDSVSAPVNWKLALGQIDISRLAFDMLMPEDTLHLNAFIANGKIRNGEVDLGMARYAIEEFTLSESRVQYDGDLKEPLPKVDPAHIVLSGLQADIRSVVYQDRDIQADIRLLSAEERSGLIVSSLTGEVRSDSVNIVVPELSLKTPGSDIRLTATVPWSLLEEKPSPKEILDVSFTAALAKSDVLLFVPDLTDDFKESYPNEPFRLSAQARGNLESLDIKQLSAELPGAFEISGSGKLGAVMDSIRRSADFRLEAVTHDLGFVMDYLPEEQRGQFRIPSGMRIIGEAGLHDRQASANLRLAEDKARIRLTASYHMTTEAYSADMRIRNLEPVHFMPNDSILWLNASLKAEGQGTDFYSPATWTEFAAAIDSVQYLNTALSGIILEGSLKENQARIEMKSDNPALKFGLTADGTIKKEDVSGIVILDAENIDLRRLQLADTTFTTTFDLFAEFKSDLKERNQADVTIGNWDIRTPDIRLRRQLLTLKARSDEDTTRVSLYAGDLGIVLTGNAGLNSLVNQFNTVTDEFNRHLVTDSTINVAELRPFLPDMHFSVYAKRDNPVYTLLRPYYISFTEIDLDAFTSPEVGLRMDGGIYSFARDTFLIDTIKAMVRPDSAGLFYAVDVVKKKYQLQQPFKIHLQGSVRDKYGDAELTYTNHHNEKAVHLGIRGIKEPQGFRFHLFPDKPIIASGTYELNPDNYFRFRNRNDMEANIRLTGKDNAFLWVHSIHEEGSSPELHVELGQINLETIAQNFASLPEMKGMFNADIQYAPMDETFMVVADANIDDFYYEKGRVGELLVNTVYLPLDNSEHQIDFHLYHDREERMAATALYKAARKTDNIEGALDIMALPLPMVNPFIPDGMARLSGVLNGNMQITGSSSDPKLNGFMQMDSSSVYIGMADTRLRFDNRKIDVKNSLISFNKYQILASGNNPFVIDGNIDISNLSRMTADLKMTAQNMQVLDARRTKESVVYGKLFMDFNTTIKGPLNKLMVRGNANLLGGTDVGYVYTDSQLTVQDRMDGLVTFTSFADTLTRPRRDQQQALLGGIDMLMVLRIDPTVQFRVDLTPDRSNYVEVEGGGDLSFQYTPQGEMVLNGRYTFSEGVVKYALPVVPLKEFNIHQGSYVQWDGEIMNPLINVVATERMRTTVTATDGNQRRANFDVGISVHERLENIQLQFIINAVDDAGARSELAAMSAEDRSRYAIYMMITGLYMGSDMNNVNLGGALGNFLAGQVNNIAGDALKGVDINIGLDTYETDGRTQNDLTFSFAKRFYNDRIRVSIGGKVSTGGTQQETESFLDNFAAEYLLDPAGSKTIKFFHDRNFENILEGEVVETGVGLVLRKKVLHLRELFDFRKKKTTLVTEDTEEKKTEVERNNTSEDETEK